MTKLTASFYRQLISLVCYGLVFVAFLLTSYSSPIFQSNPWVDSNAMLTVGRAWLHGYVPFQSLFEQRGPAMYFIYLCGALMKENSFFGVFVMEVLFGFVAYHLLVKLTRLFCDRASLANWIALVAFSAFIGSKSFRYGGAPEEFTYPFLLFLIYLLLKHIRENSEFSKWDFFFQGMALSFIFWLKYSLIGAWLGFFIFVGLSLLLKKRYRKLSETVLYALLGFLPISLIILIYYTAIGGLKDLFFVYFQTNLTSYSKGGSKIVAIFSSMTGNMLLYTVSSLILLLGLVFLGFVPQLALKSKAFILTVVAFSVILVYFAGHAYAYYYLSLTAYVSVVILVLFSEFIKRLKLHPTLRGILAIFTGLLIFYAVWGTQTLDDAKKINRADITSDLTDQFADKMRQNSSTKAINVLQIGAIDSGFYLAADSVPQVKYFDNPNIVYEKFPKIIDGQMAALKKRVPEFVVLTPYNGVFSNYYKTHLSSFSDKKPKLLLENYHLIESAKDSSGVYFLYQRN